MKQLRPADLDTAEPVNVQVTPAARGRGRLPSTLAALAERDRLLRVAAARFCVGLSENASATKLAAELQRFRSTAWRRDASQPTCPHRHAGSLREILYQILRTRDAPISPRTIRRALSYSWPTCDGTVVADK